MNILKLKSILFSLMAIVMVTVFLTSCEKNKITETPTNESNETAQEDLFLMPYGFDELSEELKIEYFENLTAEDSKKLTENHRIGSYLKSIGQLENVTNTLMSDGLLFSDVDLSKVLTDSQISKMTNYQYDDIQLRTDTCGKWKSTHYTYYHPSVCRIDGTCCRMVVQKRFCIGYSQSYITEYRNINKCDEYGVI